MANMTGNSTVDSSLRFLRVGDVGQEIPVIQDGSGRTYDLSPVVGTGDLDGAFFGGGGISLAAQALERGELPERSIEGLRVGPPISPAPRRYLHRPKLRCPRRRNRCLRPLNCRSFSSSTPIRSSGLSTMW